MAQMPGSAHAAMALQALCAYDSDGDDPPTRIDAPLDIQSEVEAIIQQLLSRVCERVASTAKPHSVPVFRASVNECEIDIDDSSSSSSWSLSSEPADDAEEIEEPVFKPPRTKGEAAVEELPPIERLNIKAHVDELSHVGRVASILDLLVTVVSFKYLPPLDLDSVLFFKDGKPLGAIFDVFGPVKEPRYLIRFNRRQDIDEFGIAVDMPVYYAPNLPYTSYVFTDELMKIKGSDASWKHDNEPPAEVKEYSDDEEERRDRTRMKRKSNIRT